MNSKKPLTLNNPGTRFGVAGDRDMFNRIVRDMIAHGGDLAPSNHWNWNLGKGGPEEHGRSSGYTDDLFDEKYSRLEMMLNPWVGVTGMKPIDDTAVAKYERFLRGIDHLAMLPDDVLSHGQANDWRETDLGSVMDANLVSAYCSARGTARRLAICEVGGGYGRLAEVLMGVLSGAAHYVLVDAVPGSMMYAYLYLRRQLPHLKIGSYYQDDPYSDAFDCYIMPAWQVQQLPDATFDICINIESLQEMEQHHVDHYLALFNRLTSMEGLIYLSNARDYVFKGEWNIPVDWEVLYFNNTPRSWTADHPTQVFRKRTGDFSMERLMLETAFNQQISAWHDHRQIHELNLHVEDRDRLCNEYKQKINILIAEAEKFRRKEPRSWLHAFMKWF